MASMTSKQLRDGVLLGVGNALLDITAQVDEDFLKEYKIGLDEAVKGDTRQEDLLQDLESRFEVERSAGGSGLNVLRAVQWVLGSPNVCTFMGCIGNDESGKFLCRTAKEAGISTACQVAENSPTSFCIVLVTGAQRSMCSFQRASGKFDFAQFTKPENQQHVARAQFVYLSGFFLSVCTKTAMSLALKCRETNKSFIFDLGAPRICISQAETIRAILPYVDVLFGNDGEYATLGKVLNLDVADLHELCVLIAKLPKAVDNRTRVVVMTRGKEPVVVGTAGGWVEYPSVKIADDKIVDVNGAGDSFLGGFLSQLIQGHSIEKCVAVGINVSSLVIQQRGCSFPSPCPLAKQ